MNKDFKSWHLKKEKIHTAYTRPFFSEREIWYCACGVNVGFEQDGKGKDYLRPVLIFKKFNKEIFWAVPLTSAIKDSKFYYAINFGEKSCSLILSQLRLIDSKRLSHKIGVLSKRQFAQSSKNLQALMP